MKLFGDAARLLLLANAIGLMASGSLAVERRILEGRVVGLGVSAIGPDSARMTCERGRGRGRGRGRENRYGGWQWEGHCGRRLTDQASSIQHPASSTVIP